MAKPGTKAKQCEKVEKSGFKPQFCKNKKPHPQFIEGQSNKFSNLQFEIYTINNASP